MTLAGIFSKLRRYNRSDYRQFEFCMTVAVMLIAAYLLMIESPIVQNALPEGGDSGRMVWLIFAMAVAGCTVFVIYATSLFLRYKSRETGVLLALGCERKQLARSLTIEVGKIVAICAMIGLVLGALLSFGVGIVFDQVAANIVDYHFAITFRGIAESVIYVIAVFIIIFLMTSRFMRRVDIMAIISEQRRQEPLRKNVTKAYLISGIILIIVGIFFTLVVPGLSVRLFGQWLGAWINLFYLVALFGIYRVMVYSIASHSRGRHPQKYYDNLLTYGLLKFQGASIVRNMLVIAVLIVGGIFAACYLPMMQSGANEAYTRYEADYIYRYPSDVAEITQMDVETLASENNVQICNYRETEMLRLTCAGTEREDIDENGKLIEAYCDPWVDADCISQSEFNRITGQQINVPVGGYYLVQTENPPVNAYNHPDSMDKLYAGSGEALSMTYQGMTTYQALTDGFGFDKNATYVLNDNDYNTLKNGVGADKIIRYVLFDTDHPESEITFARALYKAYGERSTPSMQYLSNYDAVEHMREGEDYGYAMPAVFDVDYPERATDWMYQPVFVPLQQQVAGMTYIVNYMLFIYIAVICLIAAAMIAYTRSQNVASACSGVFEDIEKLGADHYYLTGLLKQQIRKVYVLPTLLGCLLIDAYLLFILFTNDGMFAAYEFSILGVAIIFTIAAAICMFGVYLLSLRKARQKLALM